MSLQLAFASTNTRPYSLARCNATLSFLLHGTFAHVTEASGSLSGRGTPRDGKTRDTTPTRAVKVRLCVPGGFQLLFIDGGHPTVDFTLVPDTRSFLTLLPHPPSRNHSLAQVTAEDAVLDGDGGDEADSGPTPAPDAPEVPDAVSVHAPAALLKKW